MPCDRKSLCIYTKQAIIVYALDKNPFYWHNYILHHYIYYSSKVGPITTIPPFTPAIRSTTSADKAIQNFMMCPAALSHHKSYFGSERGRLTLPEYLPGGGKVGHVTSLEFCCCLTNFLQHFLGKFDNRTNQSGKCF